MKQLYVDVLHSEVDYLPPRRAADVAAQYQIQITSILPMPLAVKSVGPDGRWYPELTLSVGTSTQLSANDNEAFVLTDLATDTFVGAFTIPTGGEQNILVDDSYLTPPNDLGPPPQPTPEVLIPQDSYPVLVGYGWLPQAPYTTMRRYQYWHRADESYALGTGEEQTIVTSTTTGLQSTSSSMESVATSLGVSASAGWGPISASVSASLNTQTTTQQSLTVTETNSTYITKKLTNTQDQDIVVMHWALMDAVLFSQSWPGSPVATIEVAFAPRIVQTYPS